MSVEGEYPGGEGSQLALGSAYTVPDVPEHHGLLQEHSSSFLDAVAESHGADDGGNFDIDFDSFISDSYTTNFNDSTNDDQQQYNFDNLNNHTSTTSSGFNLDDTFLTSDLALSQAPPGDYSAFTCDVS